MVRWLVIGGVAVVALTIFALVDLFVTQAQKVRAFAKPIWIGIIVVVPVVGPLLWLFVGKNRTPKTTAPMFPDDDMGFLGRIDRESAEDRIRRLEEELRQLDEEEKKFPTDSGETPEQGGKKKRKGGDDAGDGEEPGGAGSPSRRP